MSTSPVVKARRRLGLGFFRASWCAARALAWDLRRSQPYECYSELDFDIPIGKNGDCYDRYLIRMQEMRESVKIMKQCVEQLLGKGKDRAGVVDGRQGSCHPSAAK